MMDLGDSTYWMALAHLPKWRTERINRLIIEIIQNQKLSFDDFFKLGNNDWKNKFQLNEKEVGDLKNQKSELSNYSYLAENLIKQDFNLIPFYSKEYSQTLKENLQLKYSPPLLYTKGNKKLLHESSVAIVGSRNTSDISVEFTKTIAQKCAKNYQVVVSGFAKGIDKTALDATLKVHGHSIIVLPQGILTFTSGLKQYNSYVVEGDLLVLSTYHPKATWSAGLAMGRNSYIYGLAEEIYVAESDSKGGTWSGVLDGLRKGRKIYVRKPQPNETNANDLLILRGAIPVGNDGKPIENEIKSRQDLEKQIKNVLSSKPLTAKEIKDHLHLEIDTDKLLILLSSMDFIIAQKINDKKIFRLKTLKQFQTNLFR